IRAIEWRGGRALRFDTDRFPTEVRLAARQDAEDHGRVVTPTAECDLQDIGSVWHRRLAFGRRLPDSLSAETREACVLESRTSVMGWISSLRAFHLDREVDIRRAQHKALQLRVAREVGLEIPRTLTTNDPAAVRAFAAECTQGMVTKMLSSFAIHDGGEEKVVFTTPIGPEDLGDLRGLALSPMTFQERIPKALEVRATVVGERVIAAAVDPHSVAGAGDDWRRRGAELVAAWSVYALPAQLERKILGLVKFFGLDYGALDLVLTPDGRWV